MHRAARALPATVHGLLLDLATVPLPDLLSGDLLRSVCTDVADTLQVAEAACLLREADRLVVAGWSDARAWSLACLQAEQGQGPAWEALDEGRSVVLPDLRQLGRDPHTARALALQLRGSVATPLRCADTVVGCLQLYLDTEHPPTGELLADAESLARVLGTLTANADLYRRSTRTAAHLGEVLGTRAPVEQAKGVLAERHGVGVGEAFGLLRARARHQRLTVTAVAREVLAGVPGTMPTPTAATPSDGAVPGVVPVPRLPSPADHHPSVRVSRRPAHP